MTTASQGVDASGQGAVQIKFVTRGGTNTFSGSGYHYYRNDKLNANTWFNNRNGVDKPPLMQNQTGFRVGGPIVIPGLFDGHNRAFFFVNYEEFHQPSDMTRNRTILNPAAQRGIFSYQPSRTRSRSTCSRWRRRNGQLATLDPTIAAARRHPRGDRQSGAITGASTRTWSATRSTSRPSRSAATRRCAVDYNLTAQPPHQRSLQLPEVHRLPRHAQQPRGALSRVPGRGRAVVDPQGLQRVVAFDARPKPRQRGALRLQRRAGDVLRRANA